MFKRNQSSVLDHHRKNRSKIVKTIIQAAIIVGVSVLLLVALFDFNKYKEPDKTQWTNQNGFIALSYFGVDRNGTPNKFEKRD